MNLNAKLDACTTAIVSAILDAIAERADHISAIERNANGTMPVTGIALELSPWHGSLGLSLRLTSDFPLGDSRYDSADWPHFDFTSDCESISIAAASSSVTELYQQGNETGHELVDYAHLTFIAGAEALIHPSVCNALQGFGIDAPLLTDRFISSPFQYIVTDTDETLKSNYCDFVLATRVTRRLLGHLG